MSRISLVRFCFAVLVVLQASALFAQNAGSLRGSVTDKTGAIVPGATVSLTNEGTRFARQAITDSKGAFFFAAVEPGSYTLKSDLTGFKSYEAKGIRVGANDTVGVDIVMEVGTQSETVVVTAERQLVSNETGAREGLITSEQIENI